MGVQELLVAAAMVTAAAVGTDINTWGDAVKRPAKGAALALVAFPS